jgi:hypothetical protein
MSSLSFLLNLLCLIPLFSLSLLAFESKESQWKGFPPNHTIKFTVPFKKSGSHRIEHEETGRRAMMRRSFISPATACACTMWTFFLIFCHFLYGLPFLHVCVCVCMRERHREASLPCSPSCVRGNTLEEEEEEMLNNKTQKSN